MEIAQQKMEEARIEVAAADQAVYEARQSAVQDTSLFANAEVPVEALKILHKMKVRQETQPAQMPGQSLTPTVTKGTEPFKELPGIQEADRR